jgi:hypothetical protein
MAPERVTVTIQSRAGRDAPLTVRDAMLQILNFFDLLSLAGGKDAPFVSWRLVDISMKSPVSATAEAFPTIDGVIVEPIARREKAEVAQSIHLLSTGGTLPKWMDAVARHKAREFFERNLNGIGRTDIIFDENAPPVIIVENNARTAARTIERSEQALAEHDVDFSRTEMGSVEGYVIGLTQHYRRPAVRMTERLSNKEVTCVLSDDLAGRIGHQHDWAEAWEGRRVIVSGEITHKRDGAISRVEAISLDIIDSIPIRYDDIADPNFTNGLSPAEYLEKLWEGDIE